MIINLFLVLFFLEKVHLSTQKNQVHWLESILQALFLFLLLLLLSGFTFTSPLQTKKTNPHHVIILIDDSPSMKKKLLNLPKKYFNSVLRNEVDTIDFYSLSSAHNYPSPFTSPKQKGFFFLKEMTIEHKDQNWQAEDLAQLLNYVITVNPGKEIYLLSDFKKNHLTDREWYELQKNAQEKQYILKALVLKQNQNFHVTKYTLKKKTYFLDEFLDFSFTVANLANDETTIDNSSNQSITNSSQTTKDLLDKTKSIKITLGNKIIINQPLTNNLIKIYTRLQQKGKQGITIEIYSDKTKKLLWQEYDFIEVLPKVTFAVFPPEERYFNFLSTLFYRDILYENIIFNASNQNRVKINFVFSPLDYTHSLLNTLHATNITNSNSKNKYILFFNQKEKINLYNDWLKKNNIIDFSFKKEKQIYFDHFINSTTYTETKIKVTRENGWNIPYLQANFSGNIKEKYNTFYEHNSFPLIFSDSYFLSFVMFNPIANTQIKQHPLQVLFFYELVFSLLKKDLDYKKEEFNNSKLHFTDAEYLATSINFKNHKDDNSKNKIILKHSQQNLSLPKIETILITLLLILFFSLKFLILQNKF